MVLGASWTPSEGPERGIWSCWAGRASKTLMGLLMPTWVKAVSMLLASPHCSPWSQRCWFVIPGNGAMEVVMLLLLCYALSQHLWVHSVVQRWLRRGRFIIWHFCLSPVIPKREVEL